MKRLVFISVLLQSGFCFAAAPTAPFTGLPVAHCDTLVAQATLFLKPQQIRLDNNYRLGCFLSNWNDPANHLPLLQTTQMVGLAAEENVFNVVGQVYARDKKRHRKYQRGLRVPAGNLIKVPP